MSKKNIENNDVIQEVKKEVVEVEARDAEQADKSSEPETKEVTTKEEKKGFHIPKPVKIIAAGAVTVIGGGVAVVKLISSFGNKKWDEGYEEGWHDGQETWPGHSEEPAETLEDNAQDDIEYPEEE